MAVTPNQGKFRPSIDLWLEGVGKENNGKPCIKAGGTFPLYRFLARFYSYLAGMDTSL
jgi:hypothetical protein